jgi:hypothetical protein
VFGLDRTNYADTMVGVTVSSVGTLGIAKILDGASQVADRGAEGNLVLWVPNKAYGLLVSNEAALRRYAGDYKRNKAENGFENLTFFGPTGSIEINAHPFMKEGYALGYIEDEVSRPGASDIVDGDGVSDILWYPVADSNAAEMRMYADFVPFHEAPSHAVFFTGLTYP